jgi:hypothetical protein
MKRVLKLKKMSRFTGRETKILPQRNILKNEQDGAVIMILIAAITVFSILGVGILYLVSSASFSELFINNREKAYYLAQAGRQYATMIIVKANIAGTTTPITDLNGKTFTLSDGNEFHLRTDNTNVKYTSVESTGIVNKGTVLETKQKIVFNVESIKFSRGVYAVGNISIYKDAYIDSYDSRQGLYTFAAHTSKANVQTNGISSGNIFVNKDGKLYGNAVCGAGGNPATAISANAGTISGTRTAASANVNFTAVIPPAGCSSFPTCGTLIPNIDGNTTLTAGTYRTNKIDLNDQTLTINGNVVLIALDVGGTSLNMIRNSRIIINTDSSLELYITKVASFAGTSIINPPPSPATAVRILGIETTELNFSKSSQTYGGVYAPGASFSIDSTSQFFGSVVANTISISGNGTIGVSNTGSIHIDTAFAKNEGVVY